MEKKIVILISMLVFMGFVLGFVGATVTFNNIKMSESTVLNYPSTAREVSRVGDNLDSMRGRDYGVVIMEDVEVICNGKECIIPAGTIIPTKQIEG